MHKMSIIGVSGQLGSGKDTVSDYLCDQYDFLKIGLADPIKRFGYHVFHFTTSQLWGPSSERNAVDSRYLTGVGSEHFGNAYPPKFADHWGAAEARLIAYSHEWFEELLPNRFEDYWEFEASLIHWFTWLKENYDGQLSPRIMLQTLGTEWGRNAMYENLWVDALLNTAKTLLKEDGTTEQYTYDPIRGLHLPESKIHHGGVVVSDVRFQNEFKAVKDVGGALIRVTRPDTDSKARNTGVTNHASEVQEFSGEFDCELNNNGTVSDLFRAVDVYVTAFRAQHRG